MLTEVLQTALLVAALGGFFALLRRSATRPASRDPNTGELVLQFSKFLMWTMGGIAFLGPLAMVILSFIIPFKNEQEVYVPIVLGLFFFLVGGGVCVYASRRRTRISKAGLTSEYVFSSPAYMAWEQVERIKLSGNQELFLYDGQGRRAWLHIWLVGIKEAIPLVRECLPAAVRQNNQESLAKFFKVVEG